MSLDNLFTWFRENVLVLSSTVVMLNFFLDTSNLEDQTSAIYRNVWKNHQVTPHHIAGGKNIINLTIILMFF